MHHQFADPGLSSSYKWLHGALTFMVALPSFITAFTLAASLEYAARARGGSGLFSSVRSARAGVSAIDAWRPYRFLFRHPRLSRQRALLRIAALQEAYPGQTQPSARH